MFEYVKTFSLEGFGVHDIDELIDLLSAFRDPNRSPSDIELPIKITFNQELNIIFIVDDEYKAFTLNGNKIEPWYTCQVCRHTWGFKEDLKECFEEEHEIDNR
jgi:hypothetical protein